MIIYPTAPAIVDIHNSVIEKSGGLAGVKDIGQLESILAHIQSPDYYPTFFDQITHLVYSIVLLNSIYLMMEINVLLSFQEHYS